MNTYEDLKIINSEYTLNTPEIYGVSGQIYFNIWRVIKTEFSSINRNCSNPID